MIDKKFVMNQVINKALVETLATLAVQCYDIIVTCVG
jgi:hypothetical protein